MTKIKVDCELRYIASDSSDFVFNIQAAQTTWQDIFEEKITFNQDAEATFGLGHTGQNRLLRISNVIGEFNIHYQATVSVKYPEPMGFENEMRIGELPLEIIPYTWPSRYCESDQIAQLANDLFGELPQGYSRVQAICEWIHKNIEYQVGVTNSTTSSLQVLDLGVGVCRDFAHLGISFCRALNIPARFVTGYAFFDEPPSDFHAIFEAYLGYRWILFDATKMSPVNQLVRIATGRDASDTAFSTIFGPVVMNYMNPDVEIIHSQQSIFL